MLTRDLLKAQLVVGKGAGFRELGARLVDRLVLQIVNLWMFHIDARLFDALGALLRYKGMDNVIKYRKAYGPNLIATEWHFIPECTQWPTATFIDRTDPPSVDQLCPECVGLSVTVKKKS